MTSHTQLSAPLGITFASYIRIANVAFVEVEISYIQTEYTIYGIIKKVECLVNIIHKHPRTSQGPEFY